MSDCLKHRGVISDELHNYWLVRVSVSSACAGCHARSSCTSVDHSLRHFRIIKDGRNFNVGDEVQVELSQHDGIKAVLLAYLIPLCLFILTLFVASSLFSHQALAGLCALLILGPYYFLLYRYSGVLNRSFHCTIEKIHGGL